MKNPLARLGDLGQSVWLDDISRSLLHSGRLDALITQDGLSGLTSNPTIFDKAISESGAYDQTIGELVSSGAAAVEIRETLIAQDITLAAERLAAVFDSSRGVDGWVSIEVDPKYAYDADKTVAEVERIRAAIEPPNVMIKVPATAQGVVAVQELIGRGHCINITLIFSQKRYQEVVQAYLAGLETLQRRRARGEPVPALGEVHSVASFFVSRIDTAVDKRLEVAGKADGMRGKAAIGSAKQAYRLFQEAFFGPRWDALRAEGANLQRPLWASTSTKDPEYSDILYVQELIGPHTVSTMPSKTMDAFRDHGRPEETVTVDARGAAECLTALADAGVDMEEVAADLEQMGVRAFADSYAALLDSVRKKMASQQGGRRGPVSA